VLIDRLHVDDGGDLGGAAGLRGRPVSATLLATPATVDDVQQLRELAVAGRAEIGATLLDDLLVVRLLADDTAVAARCLADPAAWLRGPSRPTATHLGYVNDMERRRTRPWN